MTNKEKVYDLVAKIPKGRVLTYGLVAKITRVNSPRAVGNFLHENKDPKRVPCHRVVHADGSLARNFAFGGEGEQMRRLKDEGIKFLNFKVRLKESLWEL